MSISTIERIGTGLAILPRVNLLPPEIIARTRLRRVQAASGGAALAALALVAVAAVLASSGIATAQQHLDAANAKQAQLKQQSGQFGDVTATYDKAGQVQQLMSAASAGDIHWSAFLNRLATTTPSTVQLKTMTVAPGSATAATATATPATAATPAPALPTISFDGYATSHDAVAHWLDVLATQKAVSDPYLTKSTAGTVNGKSVYEFTVTANVTTAALQPSAAQGGN